MPVRSRALTASGLSFTRGMAMIKIGFTGTRKGMTAEQRDALADIFSCYQEIEFHHGDCVGSDAEAHDLVSAYFKSGLRIVIHPGYSTNSPADTSMRAFRVGNEVREPKPHFARNRDIVNEIDMLVATPPCKPLPTSGGTSYTVGYARQVGRKVIVVYPDGEASE
jgi:hypothetical protein